MISVAGHIDPPDRSRLDTGPPPRLHRLGRVPESEGQSEGHGVEGAQDCRETLETAPFLLARI